MQETSKVWWKSKLVWLGIIQSIAGISELLVQYLDSPEVGVSALVSGVVTVIFRAYTSKSITVKE